MKTFGELSQQSQDEIRAAVKTYDDSENTNFSIVEVSEDGKVWMPVFAWTEYLSLDCYYRIVKEEKPKEPIDNWVYEHSSGYAGYRCTQCATWVHDYEPKVCKCSNAEHIKLPPQSFVNAMSQAGVEWTPSSYEDLDIYKAFKAGYEEGLKVAAQQVNLALQDGLR